MAAAVHPAFAAPRVFAALDKVRFRGWAVIELDPVSDNGHTPKECAAISRDYLTQKIGVDIRRGDIGAGATNLRGGQEDVVVGGSAPASTFYG